MAVDCRKLARDMAEAGDFPPLTVLIGEWDDGIQRFLAGIEALAHVDNMPKFSRITCPEHRVHPKNIKGILTAVRDSLADGSADKVVLWTCSSYLLDEVNPSEDLILVFHDGWVKPVDVKRVSIFLDEFYLGEVWGNEGDLGLV